MSVESHPGSATVVERFGGGLTSVTATVTASGDTIVDAAPGVGFKIKLYWVTAITDPDQATAPLSIIKANGGTEYYRAFAVAHWEPFTLPENTALVVNLSEVSSVAVTVHRKIVTA
jgi:hypothetical protein